ncbi:hypothetical protein BC938DRAFT_473633 [Jimgerdemannia flammicorona]|uniref:Uncharacterized protein n=1 Tax=Jimgerdemannia flammicorona TaxID=994334 RepID=A0A433Q3K7_9FUNG|nr:hypothetical protein BC938DRAFT_473633 [Jimgerdemannia flammicorona]
MDNKMKLAYKAEYLKLRCDKKWKLPSGNYLEDILYEYAKDMSHER